MPPATPPIMLSVVERVRRRGGWGCSGCGIVGGVSVMAPNLAQPDAGRHWESP
jgi:hypothetical protein